MKSASLYGWSVVILSLLFRAVPAYPHGGGLDAQGCHHDRKNGGYHCHRAQSTETEASNKTKSGVTEQSLDHRRLRSLTLDHAVVVITTARAVEKSMNVVNKV